MSPSGKRDLISHFELSMVVGEKSQRELKNTIVKIQAFCHF
jgi:hypothetical protein